MVRLLTGSRLLTPTLIAAAFLLAGYDIHWRTGHRKFVRGELSRQAIEFADRFDAKRASWTSDIDDDGGRFVGTLLRDDRAWDSGLITRLGIRRHSFGAWSNLQCLIDTDPNRDLRLYQTTENPGLIAIATDEHGMRAWTELSTGTWERYTRCAGGSGQVSLFAVDNRGDRFTHVVSWNHAEEPVADQVTIPRTELRRSLDVTGQLGLSQDYYSVVLPSNNNHKVFLVNDRGVRVISADDELHFGRVVADGFATALSSDGNEFLFIRASAITRYSIHQDAVRQSYEVPRERVFGTHYGDRNRPFATCWHDDQLVLIDLEAKEDVVIADLPYNRMIRVPAAYGTSQHSVVLFSWHDARVYRGDLPTSRTLLKLSAGIGPGGFGPAGEPMLSYYTNRSCQQVRIVNLATGLVVREFSSTHPLRVRSLQIRGDLVAISERISEGSLNGEVLHICSVGSGDVVASYQVTITP